MKTTVSRSDFRDAFQRIRPGNFTYEALGAMFDYFEQLESDHGEEMEMDVIAICCEYTQATFDEVVRDYKLDDDDDEGAELVATRYLQEMTQVVAVLDDSIVFCSSF
jgi:hypothetical protein